MVSTGILNLYLLKINKSIETKNIMEARGILLHCVHTI